ncbi:MAG: hypothetical protein GYA55_05750 [SAR324 cluster bacterium]|uniref:Uncharacterized protein n=1 Tax=SAR324 cluster bacterium TaxID=2024889 RepID=A0A7X9FRQ7_9DELT|nr:hypothetical protein [SAR324 cluster bacterium]
MQTIIILPNYSQSDEICVIYLENKEWKLTSYSQVVPRLKLPKGCGRGIPAPVLRVHSNLDFVLGQLVFRSDTKIALKSCNAGKDTTGRSVFLTAIVEGVDEANFHVDPECIKVVQHSDVYLMDDAQSQALEDALTRLNEPSDESVKALEKMWENAEANLQYSHFTSVSFEGVSYLPDSEKAIFDKKDSNARQTPVGMPKKKQQENGRVKKVYDKIIFIIFIIFIILMLVIVKIMQS